MSPILRLLTVLAHLLGLRQGDARHFGETTGVYEAEISETNEGVEFT